MSKNALFVICLMLSLFLLSCQLLHPEDTADREQAVAKVEDSNNQDEVIIEKLMSEEEPLISKDMSLMTPPERLYNIDQIDETIILPKELVEISGLSYDLAHGHLLANNDEEGIIYHLNMDGSIANTEKFGKDGDYEGIERIGDDIVVSKHNGNLYFYNPETTQTIKVKTDLTSKNDIEGLAYDEDHKLILMACKGQTLNEDNKKKEKVVYAYNLQLEVLHQEPYLVMGDPEHLSFVEYQIQGLSNYKKKALQKRVRGFSPSGIAINPANHDLYVLSARGSLVIIYDRDHELKDILFLDEDVIPQPEGICFSPEADLFISTEGKGLTGKIFKFKRI